eukprot:Hpha_TRINITY_DN16321_c3_g10::TRINITY_DN16321_c3_g10_i1::g.57826::m.57826
MVAVMDSSERLRRALEGRESDASSAESPMAFDDRRRTRRTGDLGGAASYGALDSGSDSANNSPFELSPPSPVSAPSVHGPALRLVLAIAAASTALRPGALAVYDAVIALLAALAVNNTAGVPLPVVLACVAAAAALPALTLVLRLCALVYPRAEALTGAGCSGPFDALPEVFVVGALGVFGVSAWRVMREEGGWSEVEKPSRLRQRIWERLRSALALTLPGLVAAAQPGLATLPQAVIFCARLALVFEGMGTAAEPHWVGTTLRHYSAALLIAYQVLPGLATPSPAGGLAGCSALRWCGEAPVGTQGLWGAPWCGDLSAACPAVVFYAGLAGCSVGGARASSKAGHTSRPPLLAFDALQHLSLVCSAIYLVAEPGVVGVALLCSALFAAHAGEPNSPSASVWSRVALMVFVVVTALATLLEFVSDALSAALLHPVEGALRHEAVFFHMASLAGVAVLAAFTGNAANRPESGEEGELKMEDHEEGVRCCVGDGDTAFVDSILDRLPPGSAKMVSLTLTLLVSAGYADGVHLLLLLSCIGAYAAPSLDVVRARWGVLLTTLEFALVVVALPKALPVGTSAAGVTLLGTGGPGCVISLALCVSTALVQQRRLRAGEWWTCRAEAAAWPLSPPAELAWTMVSLCAVLAAVFASSAAPLSLAALGIFVVLLWCLSGLEQYLRQTAVRTAAISSWIVFFFVYISDVAPPIGPFVSRVLTFGSVVGDVSPQLRVGEWGVSVCLLSWLASAVSLTFLGTRFQLARLTTIKIGTEAAQSLAAATLERVHIPSSSGSACHSGGVRIDLLDTESAAAAAGLSEGMQLLRVDSTAVHSEGHLRARLGEPPLDGSGGRKEIQLLKPVGLSWWALWLTALVPLVLLWAALSAGGVHCTGGGTCHELRQSGAGLVYFALGITSAFRRARRLLPPDSGVEGCAKEGALSGFTAGHTRLCAAVSTIFATVSILSSMPAIAALSRSALGPSAGAWFVVAGGCWGEGDAPACEWLLPTHLVVLTACAVERLYSPHCAHASPDRAKHHATVTLHVLGVLYALATGVLFHTFWALLAAVVALFAFRGSAPGIWGLGSVRMFAATAALARFTYGMLFPPDSLRFPELSAWIQGLGFASRADSPLFAGGYFDFAPSALDLSLLYFTAYAAAVAESWRRAAAAEEEGITKRFEAMKGRDPTQMSSDDLRAILLPGAPDWLRVIPGRGDVAVVWSGLYRRDHTQDAFVWHSVTHDCILRARGDSQWVVVEEEGAKATIEYFGSAPTDKPTLPHKVDWHGPSGIGVVVEAVHIPRTLFVRGPLSCSGFYTMLGGDTLLNGVPVWRRSTGGFSRHLHMQRTPKGHWVLTDRQYAAAEKAPIEGEVLSARKHFGMPPIDVVAWEGASASPRISSSGTPVSLTRTLRHRPSPTPVLSVEGIDTRDGTYYLLPDERCCGQPLWMLQQPCAAADATPGVDLLLSAREMAEFLPRRAGFGDLCCTVLAVTVDEVVVRIKGMREVQRIPRAACDQAVPRLCRYLLSTASGRWCFTDQRTRHAEQPPRISSARASPNYPVLPHEVTGWEPQVGAGADPRVSVSDAKDPSQNWGLLLLLFAPYGVLVAVGVGVAAAASKVVLLPSVLSVAAFAMLPNVEHMGWRGSARWSWLTYFCAFVVVSWLAGLLFKAIEGPAALCGYPLIRTTYACRAGQEPLLLWSVMLALVFTWIVGRIMDSTTWAHILLYKHRVVGMATALGRSIARRREEGVRCAHELFDRRREQRLSALRQLQRKRQHIQQLWRGLLARTGQHAPTPRRRVVSTMSIPAGEEDGPAAVEDLPSSPFEEVCAWLLSRSYDDGGLRDIREKRERHGAVVTVLWVLRQLCLSWTAECAYLVVGLHLLNQPCASTLLPALTVLLYALCSNPRPLMVFWRVGLWYYGVMVGLKALLLLSAPLSYTAELSPLLGWSVLQLGSRGQLSLADLAGWEIATYLIIVVHLQCSRFLWGLYDDSEVLGAERTEEAEGGGEAPVSGGSSRHLRLIPQRASFFRNLFNSHLKRGGKDLYAITFAVDLLAFVFFVFGYSSIMGSREGFLQSVASNAVPADLVIAAFTLFVVMIVDRVVYHRRSLREKYALQVVLGLLYLTVYVWWCTYSVVTGMEPGRPGAVGKSVTSWGSPGLVLKLFCGLKLKYLSLSAVQLREGYGGSDRRMFFAGKYDTMHWYLYIGYYAVPFLYELRCVVDWACTRTSLKLQYWLRLEDISHEVHLGQCQKWDDRNTPAGSYPASWKCRSFCAYCGLITLLLFFPLAWYSSLSPAFVPSYVVRADMKISLVAREREYGLYGGSFVVTPAERAELAASNETLLLPGGVWGKALERTRPSLTGLGLVSGVSRTLQFVPLPEVSLSAWEISAAGLEELGAAGGVELVWSFELERSTGGGGSQVMEVSQSKALESNTLAAIIALRNASGNATTSVPIPAAFAPFALVSSGASFLPAPGVVGCNLSLAAAPAPQAPYWAVACSTLFDDGNPPFTTPTAPASAPPSLFSPREEACIEESGSAACAALRYDAPTAPPHWAHPQGPYLMILSDRVAAANGLWSLIPSIGIIALYTTFVLAVHRLIHSSFTGEAHRLQVRDMERPEAVEEVINFIHAARREGELELERGLYDELVNLFRSPEAMREWVRVHAGAGAEGDTSPHQPAHQGRAVSPLHAPL